MQVIIPFKPINPKSRLSSVLTVKEREKFAILMLQDVIDVIKSCNINPLVLSSDYFELKGLKVIVERGDLNKVLNSMIKKQSCCIVMSDLPLLSKKIFKRFISKKKDVVIAPGRRGGTNMLLVRNKNFKVSYYDGSFFKHLKIAKELGISVQVFDSFFASIDIDLAEDLIELLLHGKGKKSARYLRELGFWIEFKKDLPILRRFH